MSPISLVARANKDFGCIIKSGQRRTSDNFIINTITSVHAICFNNVFFMTCRNTREIKTTENQLTE